MKVLPVIDQSNKIIAYTFECPGCGDNHSFNVDPGHGPVWQFNGDLDRPTFSPSLLVRSGCKCQVHKPGDDCWCTFEKRFGKPSPFSCYLCHTFVTNGQIQFLADCTHRFAGQTVLMSE